MAMMKINVPDEYADDFLRFVRGMLDKLHENRHKGKWENIDLGDAMKALDGELNELMDALHAADVDNAVEEAIDVANFCLIISSMVISGRNNPFASRAKVGRPYDFVKWAAQQQHEHCIIWPYRSKTGPNMEYGSLSKGQSPFGRRAHRVVCALANGAPPTEDHHAEHLCGNSLCVNPRHLRWATAEENQRRKHEHGTAITPNKLNADLAEVIRARFNAGESARSLAQEYEVSDVTIYNILGNKTYYNTAMVGPA